MRGGLKQQSRAASDHTRTEARLRCPETVVARLQHCQSIAGESIAMSIAPPASPFAQPLGVLSLMALNMAANM